MRGREALRRAASLPQSRWSQIKETVGEGSYFPEIVPKFTLEKTAVFAMGSCFAQEIQIALGALGFYCASLLLNTHDELFQEKVHRGFISGHQHFLHRFNPASFQQEMERILTDDHSLNRGALLVETKHGVLDCHYRTQFALPDRESALLRRQIVRAKMRELFSCHVFIMTLGLTEAWFDHESGLYLNSPPPLSSVDDRYEFQVLTFEQCKSAVEKVIALVAGSVPEVKIVLTVSPVPLDVTLTGRNVGLANSRSKSTLLTVANEIAEACGAVDYFPSYEIAMLSNPADVWMDDGRHLKREFVARIMDHFTHSYFPGSYR